MVALPIPAFAPSTLKAKVSGERYDALLTTTATHLLSARSAEAWRFIQTYAADQAAQGPSSSLTTGESKLRKSVFLVAERTVGDADVDPDIDTLFSIAALYGSRNASRTTKLFERAFLSHAAELNAELHNVAIPGLTAALLPSPSTSKKADESRLLRVASVLPAIVRSCQHVRAALAQDSGFLGALATAYDRVPCADLLDALTPLLSLSENVAAEQTFATLFPLLEKPALLKDYSAVTGFADLLEQHASAQGADDPRLGYVLATLRSDAHDRALPSFLRNAPAPAQVATNGQSKPTTDRKGKGKAKEVPQLDLDDPRISQLADIFPSHSREFLAKCLHHPSFSGDVDAVVGALLEGNAPPDILQEGGDATPSPSRPSTPAAAVLADRRNVFDDDELDFARLRVGKTAGDADSLLGDRAFAEQMKSDILRRVQEMSDSDAEADAAADDADDVLGAGGVVRVREGDADSDSEPQLDEAAKKQREIEHLLETEYLRDAAQFARDASTRRSKGREELRARTGWADEQLEGWAIMLERNPQKAKILAKHEFRGNRPPQPAAEDEDSSDDDDEEGEDNTAAPGASQPGRGRGRGRGRGGRGRGGGGGGGSGGGGGGDSARDRARKNARKNQDHRRGRDKKMARAGGPS